MIGESKSSQINPALLAGQLKSKSENLANLSNPEVSKTRLKETAKELEALFIYEMLKEMRSTTQGGLLGKGLGNDIYTSLFDMEIARMFAGRGIGLKEMILKQVERLSEKDAAGSPNPPKNPEKSTLNSPNSWPVSPAEKPKTKMTGPITGESPLRFPVDGRISSQFGWREDPFSGQEKFHEGIDIAAQSGQEIYPIKNGRVIFSGLTPGYGHTVAIDHGDGFTSKYSHNLKNLVTLGEEVNPNQAIALVGSTGKSTGPHLHFEVQFEGKKINPLYIVQRSEGTTG
jgi:murein DD-endopeptidase MepM/ murein hydrolase activator NlpD